MSHVILKHITICVRQLHFLQQGTDVRRLYLWQINIFSTLRLLIFLVLTSSPTPILSRRNIIHHVMTHISPSEHLLLGYLREHLLQIQRIKCNFCSIRILRESDMYKRLCTHKWENVTRTDLVSNATLINMLKRQENRQ